MKPQPDDDEIDELEKEIKRLEGVNERVENENDSWQDEVIEKEEAIDRLYEKLDVLEKQVADKKHFMRHSYPLTLHFRTKKDLDAFIAEVKKTHAVTGVSALRHEECSDFSVN
jgi:predicted RNase H-like nuclease (RuvC/YqgF family)